MNPKKSGVCVWLTGLSGAGKSTTAEALVHPLEDDPYEPPDAAEVVLGTVDRSVRENAACILRLLIANGLAAPLAAAQRQWG